jgi:hypothetical protein
MIPDPHRTNFKILSHTEKLSSVVNILTTVRACLPSIFNNVSVTMAQYSEYYRVADRFISVCLSSVLHYLCRPKSIINEMGVTSLIGRMVFNGATVR